MESSKRDIRYMSDVVRLFLSLYIVKENQDDKVYFSKEIKSIVSKAIEESELISHLSDIEEYNDLFIEDGKFNTEKFIDLLSKTNAKKYWADEYNYDLQKDMIYTHCDKKNAESIIGEYPNNTVVAVDEFVDNYICNQKEYEKAKKLELK